MGDSLVRERAGAKSSAGGKEYSAGARCEAALRRKTFKIGVIGRGYVGLPPIRTIVAAGCRALGLDVAAEKVKRLQAGRRYIEHISSE